MLKKRYLFLMLIFAIFMMIGIVDATEYEHRIHANSMQISWTGGTASESDEIKFNDSYLSTSFDWISVMGAKFDISNITFTIPDWDAEIEYSIYFVGSAVSQGSFNIIADDSGSRCGTGGAYGGDLGYCIYNFTSDSYALLFNQPSNVFTDFEISLSSDSISEEGTVTFAFGMPIQSINGNEFKLNDIGIKYYSTDNPQTIYFFNNSLETESLDFDVSVANYTRYLKIFRTATVNYAKTLFSGYEYLSSYVYPLFAIDDSSNLVDATAPFLQTGYSGKSYTNTIPGETFKYEGDFYDMLTHGTSVAWFGVNLTNSATIHHNYTLQDLDTEDVTFYVTYDLRYATLDISCLNDVSSWVSVHTDSHGGYPYTGVTPEIAIPSACLQNPELELRHIYTGTYNGALWEQTNQKLYANWLNYTTPLLTRQWVRIESYQLNSSINSALNSGACDCAGCSIDENSFCLIPFSFNSTRDGGWTYDNLEVFYDSTPFYFLNTFLISPANNEHLNNATKTFQCNATDKTTFDGNTQTKLKNMTLRIYNFSNTEIHAETKNISGLTNLTDFSYTFSQDGDYLWLCESYNNLSYFNVSSSNNTLNLDTVLPNISLLNTSDSDSYYNKNDILVNVSVSDYSVSNVTFNLYNSSDLITTSSFTGFENEINATSCSGDCTDFSDDDLNTYKVYTGINQQILYDVPTSLNSNITFKHKLGWAYDQIDLYCRNDTEWDLRATYGAELNNQQPGAVYTIEIPDECFIDNQVQVWFLDNHGSATSSGTKLFDAKLIFDDTNVNYSVSNTFSSLLPDDYFYNATVCDIFDNCNSTATYNITLLNPFINVTNPQQGGTVSGSVVTLDYNISEGCSDANYTVRDSEGVVNNNLENINLNCSETSTTFAVTSYSTFTLYINATDSVGNLGTEEILFTTQQAASTVVVGGGGGGGVVNTIQAVAVIPTEDFKTLTDLQRAIIYARILEIKDSGALSQQDILDIQNNLTIDSISLTLEEITILNNQIDNLEIDNIKVTESIAEKYGLLSTRIIIEEGDFQVSPQVLSGATAFVCAREGDEIQTYRRPVKANKLFESCQVTEGNWICEVSNDSTTAFITYEIKEPDFFIQTLEGEIKYISQNGEVDYTRVISLNLVNYCAEVKGTGIQIIWVLILGGVGSIILIYYFYKKVKKRKKK